MAISTGYIVWFLSVIPALWIDVALLEEEVSSSQIICPILHTRAHHVQNFEHNNEVPMRP